jgi:phage tail P2-like protein
MANIAPTDVTLLPPPLGRDLSCRALERLVASRLSMLDLMPLLIYDIKHVAASALPSLAEQFRVQGDAGYGFAATTDQQRKLIQAAIELHRMRGTRDAIERVLSLLGVNATVVEWFEQTPPGAPYTFSVILDTLSQPDGSPPLDPARWSQIGRLINFWKNARSAFTLQATSRNISMGVGITMVTGGTEQTSIQANFDSGG